MTALEDATTAVETFLLPRRGTRLHLPEDGAAAVVVDNPTAQVRVPVTDRGIAELLVTLQDVPCASSALVRALTGSGPADLPRLLGLQLSLARLSAVGSLDHVVLDRGRELARLTSDGVLGVPTPAKVVPGVRRLSRFAVLTVDGEGVVLQSGRTHLLVRLAPDQVPDVLTGEVALAQAGPARGVADLLVAAGLLVEPGTEDDRESQQWSACDLWFHRRTTESRSMERYGGTYPLDGRYPPLPYARSDLPVLREVVLPAPDLAELRRTDRPLADVVEARTSCRAFAPQPPTLAQLAELLYRSCRARGAATGDRGLEVVDRPFPSGGSIHELETYLVVSACDGLEPGLWRYAPERHALDLLTESGPAVRRLVQDGRSTAQLDADPPVLLLITGRFGRLMWKYEGMAYALILKHAGVLMQTLYLSSTAMGLGTCALGGASTSSFARATGLPALAEGIVGMMVLGRPASGAVPAASALWGSR